jgi:hypothetical protein
MTSGTDPVTLGVDEAAAAPGISRDHLERHILADLKVEPVAGHEDPLAELNVPAAARLLVRRGAVEVRKAAPRLRNRTERPPHRREQTRGGETGGPLTGSAARRREHPWLNREMLSCRWCVRRHRPQGHPRDV